MDDFCIRFETEYILNKNNFKQYYYYSSLLSHNNKLTRKFYNNFKIIVIQVSISKTQLMDMQ